MYKDLMMLASRAKNFGAFEIANIIFAFLLHLELEGGSEISLELETNDDDGFEIREAYYDLLVVVASGRRLCIPVPLVDNLALVSAMKHAKIVELSEHNRVVSEDQSQKVVLWGQLSKLLTCDQALEGVEMLAEYSDDGSSFRLTHINLIEENLGQSGPPILPLMQDPPNAN